LIKFLKSLFSFAPKPQKIAYKTKKEITLKIIIKNLISIFSVKDINDVLAEIYYDKYMETRNIYYDKLSEKYDNINQDIIHFGD
jgi:hypothetical protein